MSVLLWIRDVFAVIGLIQIGVWMRALVTPRKQQYPKGPLPPERIRPPAGACGVHGCTNRRPHSHVDDLVRRVRERRR